MCFLYWKWWISIALLCSLYCLLTFYLAIIFMAKDDDVDPLDVRIGAVAVFVVSFVPSFWWDLFSTGLIVFLLLTIIAVVFLVYAIEVGLIVRQAANATVLFIVMYFPGFWAIRYFLDKLVADSVAVQPFTQTIVTKKESGEMLVASIGRALGLLSCLYCLLTFYLAVVFIAKDDEVEMSDIRFGAIMVAGLASVISFGWNSLSLGSFLVLLCLVVAVVFSTYAIEVGLIVRQAAIATVLFLVMYCPGVWAIHYFLNWLVTDAVTGQLELLDLAGAGHYNRQYTSVIPLLSQFFADPTNQKEMPCSLLLSDFQSGVPFLQWLF